MKSGNSLQGFTVLLSQNKPNLTNTWYCLKKQKNGITVKSAKNWNCLLFRKKLDRDFPYGLPKGAQLRERLESFLKKVQKKAGYLPVITPHIGNVELYKTSGHYPEIWKRFIPADHHTYRRRTVLPETNELPASLRNIQEQTTFIQRIAHPVC